MKLSKFPNIVYRTLEKGCSYHDITHVRWVATVKTSPRHLPNDWGGILFLPGHPVIVFSSSEEVIPDTVTLWMNPDYNPDWHAEYQETVTNNHKIQMDPECSMTLTGKIRKKRIEGTKRNSPIEPGDLWAEIYPHYQQGKSWRQIAEDIKRPESTIYRCWRLYGKKHLTSA